LRNRHEEPPPGPGRVAAKRLLWLVAGVALMAGAGYLLAALVLFPAPLLPNERVVPRVLGESYLTAQGELARGGFAMEIAGRETHPSAPIGTVIWQDPPPGVAVARGATVSLTVSAGRPRAAVPDVRGLDPDIAQRLLWGAGLGVEQVDTIPGTQQPAGIAVGTTPAAGDSVAAGGTVVLHLSKGKR
jgi:beta-lactam-binding protein with PASTA domain